MNIAPHPCPPQALAPPRNRQARPDAQEAAHLIKIADAGAELLLAFRLLHQEYLRAGYARKSPAGMLFGRHHLLPDTAVFLVRSSRDVLSTAAVVQDSGEFGLPMDDVFENELNGLRRAGRTVAEVCALASDRRHFSREGVQAFTRLLFLYSLALGVDDVCIMVNPKHVPLYRDRCGFEVMGQERHYARVNAPAVALRSDLRALRANLPAHAHAIRAQAEAVCRQGQCRLGTELTRRLEGTGRRGQANPVDARLLSILGNECADIMRSFPHRFLEHIRATHPGLAAMQPLPA
jgi:hypothetical protein